MRSSAFPGSPSRFLDAGDKYAALRLVGTLSYLCQDTGRVMLGRDLAARVLAVVGEAGDARDRAMAHLTLGELAFREGDQPVALDATETALGLAREAGDEDAERRTEMNLARVSFRDGDADGIRRHAERMLDLAGEDPAARMSAVHMLGWAEHTAGDVEAAVQHFEDNVITARTVGNRLTEGSELLNLASLSTELGDLERAASYLRDGIDVAHDLESSYLLPGALTEAGRLLVLLGRTEVVCSSSSPGSASTRSPASHRILVTTPSTSNGRRPSHRCPLGVSRSSVSPARRCRSTTQSHSRARNSVSEPAPRTQ
jgi:tetratricopeptide (TPR) repeat protein